MSFLESITDAVQKVLPQRKEERPIPLSGGGVGNGSYAHEEDMILSKTAITLHALQIFFIFLALCCFGSVAAFQAKWGVGPSGLSGLAIFVAVGALLLSTFLVTIPVIYDKYDRAIRLARALREVRVQFILTGAGVATVPLIAFITTISAFTEPGCKDPEKDPNAKHGGKQFVADLPGWCQTKKAGAIFFWFAAICYVGSFVYAFLDWRRGRSTYGGENPRPRDPPFTHPAEPPEVADEEEGYAPRRAPQRVSTLPPQIPLPGDEVDSPFADHHSPARPRPSMDAYGAFNDPTPSGYDAPPRQGPTSPTGVSRTMQYADPYAAVRGRLAQGPASPSGPPQYGYDGYR